MNIRYFAFAIAVLTLLFSKVLFDLARFALQSDTFSHIILIPPIVAYLVSLRWRTAIQDFRPSQLATMIPLAFGVMALTANWFFARAPETRLCLYTLSYVCFVIAAGFRFLGVATVRELVFPFALLFFMLPLPPTVMDGLEIFFQHTSALAAAAMIKVSGLPAVRDGLLLFLPGFTIEVAQECSGIRSTLVLFITSLIAGYLLLRRPRDRAILAISIIPLAILRNGFRIFSLAWLSVEVNPDILDSALHHRGGPIFFALSLIPLFLLLLLLRRLEKKQAYAS